MASKTMKMNMPITSILKNASCEINLTGIKTWKARLWLAVKLFKFAAWMMGMKGNINIGDHVLGEIK